MSVLEHDGMVTAWMVTAYSTVRADDAGNLNAGVAPSVPAKQACPPGLTGIALATMVGATSVAPVASGSQLANSAMVDGIATPVPWTEERLTGYSLTSVAPSEEAGISVEILASASHAFLNLRSQSWLPVAPGVTATNKPTIDRLTELVSIPAGLTSTLASAHVDLVPLIKEASRYLRSIFGDQARLRLESEPDLESEVQSGGLLLIVEVEMPWRDAQSRLDAFDEGWWLDNLSRADGILSVILRHG